MLVLAAPRIRIVYEINIGNMNRSQKIIRTSIIGIVANVLLAAFKATVGILASSVAIVMDAVNNLSDALSSVITIIGTKLSERPADREHPFGFGRVEYFSAIIIAVLVLSAGITSLIESVKKIFNPTEPEYTTVTQTLAKHKEIVQVHGFHYFEDEHRISVDVVPDISVHDDAALIARLTGELQPLAPGDEISIVVDHNYSE